MDLVEKYHEIENTIKELNEWISECKSEQRGLLNQMECLYYLVPKHHADFPYYVGTLPECIALVEKYGFTLCQDPEYLPNLATYQIARDNVVSNSVDGFIRRITPIDSEWDALSAISAKHQPER